MQKGISTCERREGGRERENERERERERMERGGTIMHTFSKWNLLPYMRLSVFLFLNKIKEGHKRII